MAALIAGGCSTRVIPPQEGMLVQIRSTPATLTFVGEVRTAPLALPQTAGTHLLGTGLVTPQTPGAQAHAIGSRLRLWSGDTDPASAAYQNYLLNPQSQWIDEPPAWKSPPSRCSMPSVPGSS
jgi:hypothetical protein